ncbi:MAG: cyclopropane-fatty-acyl-phospholipid synthase [Alphaproteobacteria bacterium]|nr:cyclopropane-fatty-acyl-phospholipid synthase [Alphaproteobacteria bacterium]
MLFQYLLKTVVRKGSLKVVSADGKTQVFGDGSGPNVTVKLHRKNLNWLLGLNPDLKLGEAYVDGSLTVEEGDIYGFLHLLLSNYMETGDDSFFHWREHIFPLLKNAAQFNPIPRARKNAAHHYDMPDKIYSLFLDKDRQYSCAYFTDLNNGLDQAQLDKKRHIASKLMIDKPNLKILDIGSGWGGLGLYLAQETHSIVKGVTLSSNQYRISSERALSAGLNKRCSFELKDYRQEPGVYDRIVSVGMFEHVGKKNYDEFFENLYRLLADDGVCVIHSIGRFGPPQPINSFIRKYIFPGADLPTLPEILSAVSRAGLFATDLEVLRLHYAETLKRWIERLRDHREAIVTEFGENIFRMWEYYFVSCEVAFRLGCLMVFQIQLAKQHEAVPLTRDYMVDWERAHMEPTLRDIAATMASRSQS